MCNCSGFTAYAGPYKQKLFKNGLNMRYSNMTDGEAESACQQEYNADPVAFGPKYNNDFSVCVKQKKNQATGQQVVTTVTGAGNFLTNLGNVLNTFLGAGQGQLPGSNVALPPTSEPKGLGVGAWIGIIAGLGLVTGLIVYAVRSGKKGGVNG